MSLLNDRSGVDAISSLKESRAMMKRSIRIGSHRTCVSLEQAFWAAVKEIADEKNVSANTLVEQINRKRHHKNLSSAIRLFVLDHFKAKCGRSAL